MRRLGLLVQRRDALTVAAGVLFAVLVGFLGGDRVGSFDWALAATVGTAFGTTALAYVTWRLGQSATLDAAASRRLAELAEADQDAAYVPYVYPLLTDEWLESENVAGNEIPIRNGGRGVALNVEGQIYWMAISENTPLVGTTIASGDRVSIRTVKSVEAWDDAHGYLAYSDVLGRRWQTRFSFLRPWVGGPLRVEVRSFGPDDAVTALGAWPAGWEPALAVFPQRTSVT